MKVSLIATVKDAGPALEPFLESVRAQTRLPDEVVIVDGGSTDGSLKVLERAPEVTAISEPGANISMGRNGAIRVATHDLIAVTDADCVLSPDWLERILVPLEESDTDISMGFYRPAPRSFFESCAAAVSLPEASEVDPDRFMPSARSLAFHRRAIDSVGGYPEWLDIGEDMYVNHRWREEGMRMTFVPDALVWWPIRPTLRATWRQYAGYGRGDGEAGMYPSRHVLRFATYTAGPLLWRTKRTLPRALVAAAGFAYARPHIRRAQHLLGGHPVERTASVVVVPALMAFIDAAKMYGYVRGRMSRRR